MPFAELFHEQGKRLCLIYIMLQQNGFRVYTQRSRTEGKQPHRTMPWPLLAVQQNHVNERSAFVRGGRAWEAQKAWLGSRVFQHPHGGQSFAGGYRKA